MSESSVDPKRLSSLPEAEDALGVGRMFRSARELPDEQLPTLRWRLRTSQGQRAIRSRLVLRVAVVVGVAFFTGGVVGAVVFPFQARKQPAFENAKPMLPAVPERKKPRPALAPPAVPTPPAPVASPTVLTPTEAPPGPEPPKRAPTAARPRSAVAIALAHEPAPQASPATRVSEAPPGPVAPSAIAVEQALLGQAMKRLRDDHDARAALALLTEHAERFPRAALDAEASLLRTEALLTLGRRDEALALLDRAPVGSLPNRAPQLVTRGELRAAAGRWREAKRDFDDVLEDHTEPAATAKARALQERALWGRASARSRLGDEDGARADLDLSLRRFPDGRFADAAGSLLRAVP